MKESGPKEREGPSRDKEGPITRSKAEEIGNRLVLARKEMGMQQADAAELIGVSVRSISAYETGEIVPWRKLKRISEVYLRPESWILHGDPEPGSDKQLDEILSVLAAINRRHEEDTTRVLEEMLGCLRELVSVQEKILAAVASPLVPAGE